MPPKTKSKSTAASTAASARPTRVRTTTQAASVAETKVKNEKAKKVEKAEKPAKTANSSKMTASVKSTTATKKRKAEEAEEKPRETKRTRVVAQPRKPKATQPKAKPAKVVINEAPKTKLNVFVCGEGSSGELGLGTAKNVIDVKRPRLNKLLSSEEVGVVQIAVGGMHCVALTHDNKILTWGVNDQGALGRDTTWDGGYKDVDGDSDSDDEDSGLNPHESTPASIAKDVFPEGTVFVGVAAADSSSFALTDDGLVYGWGTFRVSREGNNSKHAS